VPIAYFGPVVVFVVGVGQAAVFRHPAEPVVGVAPLNRPDKSVAKRKKSKKRHLSKLDLA